MGAAGNAAMTKRKKALARAGLSVLLAALLAAGLSYRRGLTLYQLVPSLSDFQAIHCQVFSGGGSRSLEIETGIARNRIFEAIEPLTFHRPASNLIARPLGLWHRPAPEPPEAAHSFTLIFTGSSSRLSLMFSGGKWYYQNSEMEGFLPCSVQPDGAQAGEEIGKLLWEMIPT